MHQSSNSNSVQKLSTIHIINFTSRITKVPLQVLQYINWVSFESQPANIRSNIRSFAFNQKTHSFIHFHSWGTIQRRYRKLLYPEFWRVELPRQRQRISNNFNLSRNWVIFGNSFTKHLPKATLECIYMEATWISLE